MYLISQSPSGALSARRCCCLSAPPQRFSSQNSHLFSKPKPNFLSRNPRKALNLTVTNANAVGGGGDSGSATKPAHSTSTTPPPFRDDETILVGEESVPLEGVIQFEKPDSSSRLRKWGRVSLLAGVDVLALLMFSAIGRINHGFPVLDVETLRIADPFIAGWFLGAYFLGGYGEEGRGMKGLSKAVVAATKSWAVGIPLGLIIRTVTSGHIPPSSFMLVTLGSTAILLIGCRVMLFTVLPNNKSNSNDVYKRGSPFELFELLTSLVRRW